MFSTSCPSQAYSKASLSLGRITTRFLWAPHTLTLQGKKEESKTETEWEGLKREKNGAVVHSRGHFKSSVTRFNLFLIRQGHSLHIFQTPHCYQIQFHGQLLFWLIAQEPALLPTVYSTSAFIHKPELSLGTKQHNCS